METSIPPEAYYEPDALKSENERLFRQAWLFAGLKRDLSGHLDFISRNVSGIPVFVQNFHGELRAFVNVCTHRFSVIHESPKGNRPLQCLYHGWAYNSEGVPVGIPDRPRFDGLTPQKICDLSLKRWQVATLGEMVFIAAPEVALTLKEFLGSIEAQLSDWSAAFGALTDVVELEIHANWKLLVENTLEGYHVAFVHPDSLSWLGPPPGQNQHHDPHSSFSQATGEAANRDFAKLSRLFATRPVKVPDYQHLFVFPNLTLATTWGASFSVQLFEPLTADTTRMTSYVFATRVDSTGVPEEWLVNFGHSVAKMNGVVFEEDRIACERVQRGLIGASGCGILSDEESRVAAFHQQYQRQISSNRTTGGASP